MARPRPESRATAARLEDDDHVARPRCRSQGPSAIAARLSSRTTAWCGRGFGVEGDGGAVVEQDDRVARPRLRSRGRRRRSRRGGRPSGAAESPESWATAARSSRRTTESRMTAAHSSRRTTAWCGRVAGVKGDGGAIVEEVDRGVRPRCRSRRSRRRPRHGRQRGQPWVEVGTPEPMVMSPMAALLSGSVTLQLFVL